MTYEVGQRVYIKSESEHGRILTLRRTNMLILEARVALDDGRIVSVLARELSRSVAKPKLRVLDGGKGIVAIGARPLGGAA